MYTENICIHILLVVICRIVLCNQNYLIIRLFDLSCNCPWHKIMENHRAIALKSYVGVRPRKGPNLAVKKKRPPIFCSKEVRMTRYGGKKFNAIAMESRPQKTPGPGERRNPDEALCPQHRTSIRLLDQKIYPHNKRHNCQKYDLPKYINLVPSTIR